MKSRVLGTLLTAFGIGMILGIILSGFGVLIGFISLIIGVYLLKSSKC